jgi:hypothetical protein
MAYDQAQAILARFPGPVTLPARKLNLLAALVLCVGLLVFCVLVLVPKIPDTGWYDAVMSVFSTLLFAGGAVRLTVLLLMPGALGLKLDADGFEIRRIVWRERLHWHDIDHFRVEMTDADAKYVRYEKLDTDGVPPQLGAKKKHGALPVIYPLPLEELAWLMNAWRDRAFGPHAAVPQIAQRI